MDRIRRRLDTEVRAGRRALGSEVERPRSRETKCTVSEMFIERPAPRSAS